MAKTAEDELRGVPLTEHPVARAWTRARPGGAEPAEVTLLKRKGKSAIYRLTGMGTEATTVVAKRCERETAQVEHTVYAEVLPRLPVPSLRYYGYAEDPEGRWGWLFLEESVATKYSPALEEHRRLAGRWLGLLHTSAAELAGGVPLPDRGPGHYLRCLHRVDDTLARNLGNPALSTHGAVVLEAVLGGCRKLVPRWGHVERLCARMPRTLVHGDFIKRNLRVRTGAAGPTLVPFDWEIAGWGVPAVDLVRPPFSGHSDLTAYWEVVRHRWPGVDLPTVQCWGTLGTLFRFLAAADWAVLTLVTSSVEKSVSQLAIYRDGLADAVQALGWGE